MATFRKPTSVDCDKFLNYLIDVVPYGQKDWFVIRSNEAATNCDIPEGWIHKLIVDFKSNNLLVYTSTGSTSSFGVAMLVKAYHLQELGGFSAQMLIKDEMAVLRDQIDALKNDSNSAEKLEQVTTTANNIWTILTNLVSLVKVVFP